MHSLTNKNNSHIDILHSQKHIEYTILTTKYGVHKHNQLKYNKKTILQISQFGIKRVFDVIFVHHMNDDVIGGVVFIIQRLLT